MQNRYRRACKVHVHNAQAAQRAVEEERRVTLSYSTAVNWSEVVYEKLITYRIFEKTCITCVVKLQVKNL